MVPGNLKPFTSINKVTFHKVCGSIIIVLIISLAVFKYLLSGWDESEKINAYSRNSTHHDHHCFNRFIDKDKRHMRIDKKCQKERLIVVGDVHGCLSAFRSFLKKANFSCSTDLVVLTGDFSNKGPSSKDMIQYLRSHHTCVLTVMGNHEHKVLEFKSKKNASSENFSNSTEQKELAWTNNLEAFQLQFIASVPYSISFPNLNLIVVHASLDPSLSLLDQKKEVLMSIKRRNHSETFKARHEETNSTLHSNATTAKLNLTEGWAAKWNQSQLVIFGHDSARGLQLYDNAIGIDTGCVYGKNLTGVLITAKHKARAASENKIISVKCLPECIS